MAFYDNLGKRIQQSGQGAVDWTKRNTEVIRLNGTVAGLEKEITSQYTELGRLYYQKHAGDEGDPDLVPYFQSISDKLKTMEDCQNQINELKGYRKCINCGRDISGSAVFCNYCGARQVPEYTASSSGRKCPNCGAPLEGDQAFCTECGTRLEVSEPEQEAQRHCTKCGAVLEKDAVFCTNCGEKNEVSPEAPAADSFEPEKEIIKPDPKYFEPEYESESVSEQEPAPEPEPGPELEGDPVIDSEPTRVFEDDIEDEFDSDPLPEYEFKPVSQTKQEPEPEAESVRFCVNCGAPLEEGDMFCTNCGQKVES